MYNFCCYVGMWRSFIPCQELGGRTHRVPQHNLHGHNFEFEGENWIPVCNLQEVFIRHTSFKPKWLVRQWDLSAQKPCHFMDRLVFGVFLRCVTSIQCPVKVHVDEKKYIWSFSGPLDWQWVFYSYTTALPMHVQMPIQPTLSAQLVAH